jgi:hypothetical protein
VEEIPMALRDMRAWTYTDDQGVDHEYAVAKYISDQENVGNEVLVGGEAAIATLNPIPKGMKPRKAYVVNAAGVKRQVVCFTADAPLFATMGTSINLKDGGGVETAFTSQSTCGERKRKRAVGV